MYACIRTCACTVRAGPPVDTNKKPFNQYNTQHRRSAACICVSEYEVILKVLQRYLTNGVWEETERQQSRMGDGRQHCCRQCYVIFILQILHFINLMIAHVEISVLTLLCDLWGTLMDIGLGLQHSRFDDGDTCCNKDRCHCCFLCCWCYIPFYKR